MKRIIKTICHMLDRGERFALATIMSRTGSTPRAPGTKMIVRTDGETIGTIGGGFVEAEVVHTGQTVLKKSEPMIRTFETDATIDADGMDMICGGTMDILIEPVDASPSNIRFYDELNHALIDSQKGILIADLGDEEQKLTSVRRCLMFENARIAGETLVSQAETDILMPKAKTQRAASIVSIESRRLLVEPVFVAGTVFLFGAGHVSRCVAALTHLIDFRTVVLDDREEFAHRDRFENADAIRVLTDFETAFKQLTIDEDSYIVIVTRGHHHDHVVLSQALGTTAGYIGMIGSKPKRDAIFTELRNHGFTDRDLLRVHCPIGLEIRAETPAEIAVSIVAELIAVRAGGL